MLSLKQGFALATINNKTVYVNDEENNDENNFLGKFVDIGKDKSFQVVPPNDSFRLAIFGASGSGKSTFVAGILKEYKKKYKKNKIYMISPTQNDPAYEDLKKQIEYIKIDQTLLDDPISFTEFNNAVLIFDDCECLSENKEINKQILLFRDQCLELGRKSHISTIVINHVAQAGAITKKVLNECQEICVFPKSNFSAVQRLSKTYFGFGRDDLEYLRTVPSRWALIKTSYPQCVVSQHQIKVL